MDRSKIAKFAEPQPESAAPTAASPSQIEILYEDELLLAVNKSAGLPPNPLGPARTNLFDALKRQRPGAYLGLHHRLDRDTSGVIVLQRLRRPTPSSRTFLRTARPRKSIGQSLTGSRKPEWSQVERPKLPWPRPRIRATNERVTCRKIRWRSRRNGVLSSPQTPHKGTLHIEARPALDVRIRFGHIWESPRRFPFWATLYGYRGPAIPRVLLHAKSIEFPFQERRSGSMPLPLPIFAIRLTLKNYAVLPKIP